MSQPPPGDRLALLYRLSQAFNSTLDLDEVLNRVMDEVIAATQAERGFVMLAEPDGRLTFRAARGMDQRTLEAPQFQISRSLVERVAYEGQPVLTSDAQHDARFSMRQSVISMGLRSILCVPLTIKDQVKGVIYVDNRRLTGIFTPADLELLVAIAANAAMAIENARLYRVAVEKGRLERELQMAAEVQISLLPQETPQIAGWELAARWLPATEVAGDFYDFLPCGAGSLGWLVADVSGKGMPAALFMALSRSLIRASMTAARALADGMAQANRLICADAANGMFVTLFYAELDPTGGVTYVNAGHNPPLLCGPARPQPVELTRTGILLGVDEGAIYTQRSVSLAPGDFLVCYTDGVTEALDATGREFGVERLAQASAAAAAGPAPAIADAIVAAVGEFTGGGPPFDDVAIVIVKKEMR